MALDQAAVDNKVLALIGRAIGWLVLIRILEDRFGEVPQRIRNRILAAEIDVIKVWVERALDAPILRAVFGPD